MQTGNLNAAIPVALPDELVDTLISQPNVRIERIVSKGHASPDGFWYDQEENEWVLVVQGEAILEVEGVTEPVHLRSGAYINLPAHVKHRVVWTAPGIETIWLAVFYQKL